MSYVRPTPRQREILAAVLATRTIAEAAALLNITVAAANGQLADARKRTGMTNEQMIHAGTRDGWLSTREITA